MCFLCFFLFVRRLVHFGVLSFWSPEAGVLFCVFFVRRLVHFGVLGFWSPEAVCVFCVYVFYAFGHLRLVKCQRDILLANSPGVHLCVYK